MKHFLLFYEYVADYLERRAPLRRHRDTGGELVRGRHADHAHLERLAIDAQAFDIGRHGDHPGFAQPGS